MSLEIARYVELKKQNVSLSSAERVLPFDTAVEMSRKLREQRYFVGATSGSFDLFHPGHLDYVEELARVTSTRAAREGYSGGIVFVAVNSDESTRRNKGVRTNNRPVYDEKTRALLVAGMRGVDFSYIFDYDDQLPDITPHIFQASYGSDNQPEDRPELQKMQGRGTKLHLYSSPIDISTTAILKSIRDLDIR